MKIKTLSSVQVMSRSKGHICFHYLADGRIVAQKWPRRRGDIKRLSKVTQDQVIAWDAVQLMVKSPAPSEYASAVAVTGGTAFYPRDVLVMAAFGNYISWPGVGWMSQVANNIQVLLDGVTNVPGAMLVRDTVGWHALLPAVAGQVLTGQGVGVPPAFQAPAPAAPGLWSGILSPTPTIANTGLGTWLNQGSTATRSNQASGLVIADEISTAGDTLRGLTATPPATPYHVDILISSRPRASNTVICGLGWYDGSAKLQLADIAYNGGWEIIVQNWNSTTSFNSNAAVGPVGFPNQMWISIGDDGTNATLDYSLNGATWKNLFSTPKSSGFLGSTGYSHLAVMIDPHGAGTESTILSYKVR